MKKFLLLLILISYAHASDFSTVTVENALNLQYGTASTVPYLDSQKNFVSSSVGPVQLGYIGGLTSDAQTQLNFLENSCVFSVTASSPIASTGGQSPIVSLNTTAVTPGTYNAATITVDQWGRITAASGTIDGVSSVSNSDGTLTVSPTSGAVSASLNLGNANTWTGTQTFGTANATQFNGPLIGDVTGAASENVLNSEVGYANGVASLDSSGKVPVGQLPSVVMEYQGAWNPTTNSPALSDGSGANGNVYYVATTDSGTIPGLNDPSMYNFQIGDLVIYSISIGRWQLVTPAAGVQSVNGAQGAVVVNAINQLTSDVTTNAASQSQSEAATIAAIQGTTVSGTTGTTNVVFSASPTLTGTLTGATANFTTVSGSGSGLTSLNASNISSGTLSGDRLPNPSPSTLGGIESITSVSHEFLTSISTSGVVSQAQPAFTDISGSVAASQLPNPSPSTLGGIESYAAVSHQWINTISTSGVPSSTQPACGDLSNSAASCSTDTTNASNISSGTLSGDRLPNPSPSTLGGIESITSVSHEFLTSISTSGVVSQAQPAFTDISGSVAASQLPNPSPSTLGGIESYAAVSHQWINTISTSGVPSSTQPACGDLSNSAASCSTDTTNASNISSGTLSGDRLPNPSPSTLGGIESITSVSHEFLTSISTSGVVSQAQPAFTDISGSVAASQMPALISDVTSSAGSVSTTVSAIQGTAVSGTTGSTNVVFSTSPTIATPTFTTSATDPLLIGGSSSSSSLILESTSGSGSTDYIAFKTASQSEKMRITDAGNVGIGTTNPTTALYVSGTATATTFSGAGTSLTGTASSLTCGNVTTNANLTGPITSSGNATSIASQTGTGTTFAMSASPNFTGNVGIGTTNPVDALEINGSALVDNTFGVGSTNSSAALMYLGGGTNPLTETTQMGIESNYTANSSATTAVRGIFSQNNTAASLATGLSVNFYANGLNLGASSSSTRHIDFFSNGADNHTATDNASLSDNNAFTGNYFIYQHGTDSSSFGGQLFAPNMTDNGTGSTAGEVCWVTSTGKLVYDTSGTCFASSREVKQNIESLDGSAALAEIMAFRPVIFEYKPENTVKEDVGHKHLGLIAEEVNEIDKRLVKYKSDGVTPSGVKYQEFVSPLIASVQEQQKEIEELRAEIKEFKRSCGQ